MQRYRRAWYALFFVLLLGFAASSVLGQGSGGLDIVLLVDSSRSTAITDPDALRVTAAQFLLDYVQAVGDTQGTTHRFAAANFNTKVQDEITWTYLQGDAGRDRLVARSEGGTDFEPALNYALTLRRESDHKNPMVVVLFTDGKPDPASDLSTYFRDLAPTVTKLQDAGAHIFVVALGDDSTAAQWRELIGDSNYRFVDDSAELAGVYHDFLAGLLGLGTESVRALPDGASTMITVEPYLEQLVLSVIKSTPAAQVTVTAPSGVLVPPVRGGDDAWYSVYTFPSPDPGHWKVSITGGTAQMWVDRQYSSLVLDAPETPQPLGTPIEITGRLLRHGIVVDDPDLQLSVTAVGPDEASVDLVRRSNGRYRGELELSTEGIYTLTLSGEWSGQPVGARQPAVVTTSLFVIPALGLPGIEGELIPGSSITVTVSVSHADRIGPDGDLFVRLLRADGSTVETSALHDDGGEPDMVAGDGIFAASLTLPTLEGLYYIECALRGTSRNNIPLDEAAPQQVVEVRSHSPLSYSWLLELLLGLFLLGLIVLPLRRKIENRDKNDQNKEKAGMGGGEGNKKDPEQPTVGEKPQQPEKMYDPVPRMPKIEELKELMNKGDYDGVIESTIKITENLEQERGLGASQVGDDSYRKAMRFAYEVAKKGGPSYRKEVLDVLSSMEPWTPTLKEEKYQYIARTFLLSMDKDDIIKELYELLAEVGWHLLRELCNEVVLKDVLDKSTDEHHSQLVEFAEALLDAVDNPQPFVLHQVSLKARRIGRSGDAIAVLYEQFARLAKHQSPLQISNDITDVRKALQVPELESLSSFARVFDQVVSPLNNNEDSRGYWKRVFEHLKSFLKETKDNGRININRQLPEGEILWRWINQWMAYSQVRIKCDEQENKNPPEIVFSIAPELSLEVIDEESLENDGWRIHVPIHLCNVGQLPAWRVRVSVTVQEQEGGCNSEKGTDEAIKNNNPYLPVLDGGEVGHLIYELKCSGDSALELQVSVSYNELVITNCNWRYKWHEKQHNSNPQRLRVPSPDSQNSRPLKSPYTLEPIKERGYWEDIAGNSHASKIVREIMKLHGGNKGHFVRIIGLRKTGKTTILQQVKAKLNEQFASKFIWLELNDKFTEFLRDLPPGEALSEEALRCAILDVIRQNYAECMHHATYEELKNQDNLELCKDDNKLKKKIFDIVQEDCKRESLWLVIDGGDISISQEQLLQAMPVLQTLMEKREAIVLLVHDVSDKSLIKGLNKKDKVEKTRLLNREKSLALLERGGFNVTDLGKETFWQLTGGYPLLVHLLGKHLYEQWKKEKSKFPKVVSNGAIKKAVKEIMTDEDKREHLEWIEDGFTREEKMVLWVLAHDFTDEKGGYLTERVLGENAVRERLMERLQQRFPDLWNRLDDKRLENILEHFEKNSLLEYDEACKCPRWRVGWLYLLMKEKKISELSQWQA